jgi:uncharacterized protein (DUF2249 family)
MIKIDKNITIPDKRNKYPWDTMEIGDSFYTNSNVRMLTHTRSKVYGHKYSVRKEENGFRVWRVA